MAKQGSCLCGKIRISYEGEPVGQLTCHCLDCHKISGSTYSTNILVPGSRFKLLSGTPKTFTKVAGSGKEITSYFCGDCGSTLWRETPSFGDNKIVKVGVVDDLNALNEAKPVTELYTKHRASWVPEIPGAVQQSQQ
ncbi:Mss4-like protein [Hypoxylon sp. FL0890]|nr:Mss4-like protein [Hypoxylon sp. FL0890]